jgi:hypothetical protein
MSGFGSFSTVILLPIPQSYEYPFASQASAASPDVIA